MGRMFGTDGVRGVANRDLSPLLAFRIGRAFAARIVATGEDNPRIMVGRDTRVSGPMLEGALTAGIASTGVDVQSVGTIPTPGIACLVRLTQASGGVVISASHNPVEDNGIKCFGPDSYKIDVSEEEQIEMAVEQMARDIDNLPTPIAGGIGTIMPYPDGLQMYADHILSTVKLDLSDLTIVIDCAHGAAVGFAGTVLRRLGARVFELNVEPDGLNINVNCGSTDPDGLCEAVIRHEADLGLAFDGDADRLIAVDANGEILDGDRILAVCGRHLLDQGRLAKRTLVATPYSNMGLIESIEAAGGHVVIADAGDRNVLQAMIENEVTFGGEQSGHIIFLEHNTTGDGLLAGLQLLQVMYDRGMALGELAAEMHAYPQLLVSVPVKKKDAWDKNEQVMNALRTAQAGLHGSERLYVRASGTEPVIRVMGEMHDRDRLHAVVDSLVKVIEKELG